MKLFASGLALFLAITCVCAVPEFVVQLSDKVAFDDFLGKEKHTLVEFYAPWCGHCKALAPQFEKAAETLSSDNIKLAKVDCTQDEVKDVCARYEVQGYPTLKFFSNGQPIDYKSKRESPAIIDFVRSHTGPAVEEVTTAEMVLESKSADKVVMVFFKSEETEEITTMYEEFEKIAEKMRDEAKFFVLSDTTLAETLKIDSSKPGVTLLRSFDEEVVAFEGKVESELEAFITEESYPLCGQIGPENYMKYQTRNLPIAWVAANFDAKNDKGEAIDTTDKIVEIARGAAKGFKSKLSVVYIDGEKFKGHLENLGLTTVPGIVITDMENKKYILGESSPTEDIVADFFTKYFAKELEPYFKSEDVPATNDQPVKVIVGKTFDDIVINNDNDVLVEFYAPWCGHCKSLAPQYDDLAERFENNPKIVIAKVDATTNDTPIDVQGFPTIKFWPAGKKDAEPLEYQGARTADELEKFLNKEATNGDKSAVTEEDEEDETEKEEL